MLHGITLLHGDCIDKLSCIPASSVDMILTDLPYGTTSCAWDTVVPFAPMWREINRVIRPGRAVALFGSEPFSSKLRVSNLPEYKYDWVWNKRLAGNGILAKRQPLKIHELVHIFNAKVYLPQKTKGKLRSKLTGGIKTYEGNGGDGAKGPKEYRNDEYYPTSIQEFSIANLRKGRLHPTQKPVALLEYLIKTYTSPGDTVLDFTMGSGSTGEACLRTGRKFIGIERDARYFAIAEARLTAVSVSLNNP